MKYKNIEIGIKVLVYDRYLFAIPLKAIVEQKSDSNDGIRIRLLESNNAQYPIGRNDVWVHAQQLKRDRS